MAIQLTHEQVAVATDTIRDNEASLLGALPPQGAGNTHEYELNQLESLTFLYNLLYDEVSGLSKADILNILNSLKVRENTLPFSFADLDCTDLQGVKWPPGLREKFSAERLRIAKDQWFHNVPGSRERALKVCPLTSAPAQYQY